MGTAGNRIHGTTRERPLDPFLLEVEKKRFLNLFGHSSGAGSLAQAKLHGNCHLQIEKCYYSAPYYLVHRELWIAVRKTCGGFFMSIN